MAARKSAGFKWPVAIVLSLISLLFILITLLSGVGGHITASYLTIDTTNLALPAKLGNSVFLQDLSSISGSDLVGQTRTRQSLGLSTTYSVSLLTACGRNDDGTTTCLNPYVGFVFNPSLHFKLGGTAAQGTLSTTNRGQLRTYAAVSVFVAVGYILASLLTALSCLTLVLSRRFARTILVSRISSGIGAALVLAATIASIVTFVELRDVFNGALADVGVKTATSSSAFGLSVAASIASVVAFVLTLLIRPAVADHHLPYHHEKQSVGGGPSGGVGILQRVTTWNQARYTPLEGNKLPSARSRDHSPESDRDGLLDPAREDVAYDGSAHENRYLQRPWATKDAARRDLDHVPTAYNATTA